MDNFYRAKNKENGEWVYGIYLPLLDGACMIPDDARICRKAETVDGEEINGHLIETVPIKDGEEINGHLIETVPIKRSTLGMCLGLEDNAGIPVFSGDYIKVKTASVIKSVCGLDAAVQDGILLAEETDRGFLLCGNIYDNPELTPEARKNSIA